MGDWGNKIIREGEGRWEGVIKRNIEIKKQKEQRK